MQKGMTDRDGRSHPPQCTTSHEDRQIVRMAVMDHSVTSQTIVHHIESVTHHSASTRTIRRRLQQSGRCSRCQLLGLPLTQIRRLLRDRKDVVHGCSTIDPYYTPCCHIRSNLATCGIYLLCCISRIHPKSL
ncbi:transposable element Tcb1 transposase [Trichonephila clavipes]|nr:transposable element Tcb1 transposase [Trichonephila clavipes]